jgi:thiamine biosynthesis lipoprotein
MFVPALTASFAAFGSTISLIGVGVSLQEFREGVEMARRLGDDWDQQFSRFRPDSLLSRVNSGLTPVEVTADFLRMLDEAIAGARQSAGRFDPAVLPAVKAAGYREDFDQLRGQPMIAAAPVPSPGLSALEGIEINRYARTGRLPPDVHLDFGGLAKGAFADSVASLLAEWPGGSVDAGGDLRVWGAAPDGPHWRTGIEHPFEPEADLRTVEIRGTRASGVATSGTNRRRWHTVDGRMANHLIDPRTGRPVERGPQSVTVFAPTARAAEITAKSVLIAASRREPIDLNESALAILVWDDSTVHVIEGRTPDATLIETHAANCQPA